MTFSAGSSYTAITVTVPGNAWESGEKAVFTLGTPTNGSLGSITTHTFLLK